MIERHKIFFEIVVGQDDARSSAWLLQTNSDVAFPYRQLGFLLVDMILT
jgi:hypothetical protein